jgi:hypothetical protein
MPVGLGYYRAMLEELVEKARTRAKARVAELRAQRPDDGNDALAKRLVKSAASRAGWSGAATGTLALITLPIGLPAGIAISMLHEAELIFALLELYGLDTEGEQGRAKLYALWAGSGFAPAARSVGLKAGAKAIGAVMRGSLPGQIIRRLNPALIKFILGRLGLGWLPRAMKLWPILGAPISYVIDRTAISALGEATLATLKEAAASQEQERAPVGGRYRKIKLRSVPV